MKVLKTITHHLFVLAMLGFASIPRLSAQTFTTLYSFAGFPSDGADPVDGLILSGNTLYGTASEWGANSNFRGTVFAIKTNGTGYTNLYSFTANDGGAPVGGLILSGNTLYGTTVTGGIYGNGTVFSINTDGTDFTNLYSFTYLNDGGNPYAGLILSGNTLYGTTYSGGSSNLGTVFAINSMAPAIPTCIASQALIMELIPMPD
jgi:uncharacterized repeat protein (TIGR03803 family)